MNRATSVLLIALFTLLSTAQFAVAQFRAGVSAVDISPRQLPAIRNGGFIQATLDRIDDPLYSRSLVLSDGSITIAIVIVDSCMIPTDICDAIKQQVAANSALTANRICISATHTHSAPSVMSMCLGSGRDEAYTEFVVPRVAAGIVEAYRNMAPAEIGWTSIDAAELTNCRRWITRHDRRQLDPFGQPSVRAMMHPGYQNPHYVCPAGPIDPELTVISVMSVEPAAPRCVLANYSMHYFGGGGGFSADYFGIVANHLETKFASASDQQPGFVGIMSQGTSGDLHWMDYSKPQTDLTAARYAQAVTEKILAARETIVHRSDIDLAMAETRLLLRRRTPSPSRLAWAEAINRQRGDRPPRDRAEVYAQQATWIDANPETELTLQAIRIGELGITAIPNEVYGITGLKLKQQSPLVATFNLELAGGAEGYIPPPEQHRLGGYTTWPARTAGLAVDAEPQIVESLLGLLEQVSGKRRRDPVDPPTDYSEQVKRSKPVAYWRLGDMAAETATDAMANHPGTYQGALAMYLPAAPRVSPQQTVNRGVYFAGGRMIAELSELDNQYSVEMWIRNEMPTDGRPVTGYVFSRGLDGADGAPGDSLGIGGTHSHQGRLFVFNGNQRSDIVAGDTPLDLGRWHHVALVRRDRQVQVYLDGQLEIDGPLPIAYPGNCGQIIVGGRNDRFAPFDGMIDEVAVYDRALTEAEIARRCK